MVIKALFGALFLATSLTACLESFPPPPDPLGQPGDAALTDGGPSTDAQRTPDRAVPRGDGGPTDARVVPPDTTGGCAPIELGATSLRIRAWEGAASTIRIRATGGCPPLAVTQTPQWLDVTTEPGALVLKPARLEAQGPTHQTAEVAVQDAEGNMAFVDVALEHFTAGSQRRPKVLIYAVGGLTIETMLPTWMRWLTERGLGGQGDLPNGALGLDAATWASLVTGVEPGRHGIEEAAARSKVPSLFERLGALGLSSTIATQWAPLADVLAPDLQVRVGDASAALQVLLAGLADPEVDAFFLAANGPAAAAEADRAQAVEAADVDLDRILSAIAQRPDFADEDWLLVLVGVPGRAGGTTARFPLALTRVGGRAVPLPAGASLLDVVPTVIHHFGLGVDPTWLLPGDILGGEPESDCGDNQDNDGDGRIDCRDADCENRCDFSCITDDGGFGRGRLAEGEVANLPAQSGCNLASTGGLAVRWTAPSDDRYLVHSDGSALNTVVYIRPRDCAGGDLTCGSDLYIDDREVSEPGALLLTARAGESYVLLTRSEFGNPPGHLELQVYGQRAECEAAIDLGRAVGAVAMGSNRGAPTRLAPTFGGALCDNFDAPSIAYDMLYRWRAPSAGRWRFSTAGSNFDTVLRVFSGPCSALAPSACNDDLDRQNLDSQVDVQLAADEAVLVVLSGYWRSGDNNDGDRGDFQLSISAQ